MPQRSAGLLLFRRTPESPELFLVHFGGPFWAKKDDGAWGIPKGLCEAGEDALETARREFEEETGCKPTGDFFELGAFKQPGGKVILAWAGESDFDLTRFQSNTFTIEWPPRSGRRQAFPEADRAGWFAPAEARRKVVKGQVAILEALLAKLDSTR